MAKNMDLRLRHIGRVCQRYRQCVLHMSAEDVGKRLGYSKSNIYGFENGYINNAMILLWYISKGVTLEMLMEGGYKYG